MTGYYNGGAYSDNLLEGNSYRAMKNRCYCRSYRAFNRYGGRGIEVCDRWLGRDGFRNFLQDMGKKPSPKHTLDRIDNDRGYSPSNCRWATPRQQVNNSTRIKYIELDGRTKSLQEWLLDKDMTPDTYYSRLRRGWTVYKSLTEPIKNS